MVEQSEQQTKKLVRPTPHCTVFAVLYSSLIAQINKLFSLRSYFTPNSSDNRVLKSYIIHK